MERKIIIENFWKDVLDQKADLIRGYFKENAVIKWHNTNEQFQVEEFLIANCEYPGEWTGCIERMEEIDQTVIAVVKVWAKDQSAYFHVVGFYEFDGELIMSCHEYWGDDGSAPKWRLDKHIGCKIID